MEDSAALTALAVATEIPSDQPSDHFPLQARRELRESFAYLQARERADYYQAIIRIFLRNARRFYRIYLTAEQIVADLMPLDADYTVEKARTDLDQLSVWGNVVKTFDTTQRHTTIESFLHPTVLYRATPTTLEIEETFLRLEGQTEAVGELRKGDLAHLVDLCGEIDRLLRPGESGDDDARDPAARARLLAETWRRLADHARTVLDNTSKYIHTLAVARQEAAASDIQGYVRYKAQVVEYVQSFALTLERVSLQLRQLFRRWEENGGWDRLLAALAQHSPAPRLAEAGPEESLRDAESQLGAVTDWFRGPEWAEYFGRAARFEVNAVLQRAQLLAATAHLSASYLNDLEALAQRLLRAESGEAAAQTFAVAFAHATPRLLPEHLTVSAGDAVDPWQDYPTVALGLQPISRRASRGAPSTQPIRDLDDLAELRAAERSRRLDRLERLERLLGRDERSVDELVLTDDADVLLVLGILRHCLEDSGRRWRAEDGSTVALLNPDERALAVLRSPRGRYLVPRYRLKRSPAGARSRVNGHV